MAQHQEIERKFLLKRLPKDWKHHRSMRIVQGYFPVAGKELEIRSRADLEPSAKELSFLAPRWTHHRTEVNVRMFSYVEG